MRCGDGYDPAGLTDAEAVEVLPHRRGGSPARLTGADADRVADLWRRLPPGRQKRCHNPVYTVRFFGPAGILTEGSVCWECHNIHVTRGYDHITYEFDADAPTSRLLLAECRRAAGEPPADDGDG